MSQKQCSLLSVHYFLVPYNYVRVIFYTIVSYTCYTDIMSRSYYKDDHNFLICTLNSPYYILILTDWKYDVTACKDFNRKWLLRIIRYMPIGICEREIFCAKFLYYNIAMKYWKVHFSSCVKINCTIIVYSLFSHIV